MSYELPFILYDNVLDNSTLVATSEASGYPVENLVDWLDWTYWKGTDSSDQYIDIDKGAAGIEVDTIAVLGHNLGSGGQSTGGEIDVYEDDNPSYSSVTPLGQADILNDNPFFFSFTPGTQRYNRIYIHSMEEAPYAAVIVLGKKMTIPVGPEFSFDPDKQSVKSEKYVNYSGRIIGSGVKYSERDINVPFRRLPQSFIDSDLLPFLEDHYGQMLPFFFVPDPGDVFGNDKIYYLIAPDDPMIELPVYGDNIAYRDWTLKAQGVRQSTFR